MPEIADATTHPMRAYSSSDFLSNLLVLLLRVMNVGLSDSGLLTHLSEATAGSLNGIGHSTAYEEMATYSWVSDPPSVLTHVLIDERGAAWP